MTMKYQPGTLVKLRNRDWIVLPSNDENLLIIKPLGGTEDEITGIFLPFNFNDEKPTASEFPLPTKNDIGVFSNSTILYNAARLSFRNVAGPFRSFGRLSFRLRAYQVVPLIMALRQDVIRLLIADDVGIGKTIEALTIVRELLDRGEIKRFAVICPPHLCDQWQQELKEKFSIDAVIIRSSTAAQLDRKLNDESIFKAYPYQVISIDFIKSERKKPIFLADCPELVVVDEVHTCARPEGASEKQKQRYHLIRSISNNPNQHLILLTATPHSGKSSEFQSLLGFLKPEFEYYDLTNRDKDKGKDVAKHLIIRRRADIEKWIETTNFPKRDAKEISYELSPEYNTIFNDLLNFVREFNLKRMDSSSKQKFRYFTILTLLRGVMSSPQTGIEMLSKKSKDINDSDISNEEFIDNTTILDPTESNSDLTPSNLVDKADFSPSEIKFLSEITDRLKNVKDNKAEVALHQINIWLKDGFNPIVFCRFISTAKYLSEYFKGRIPENTDMLVITGEMVDELRKEKIQDLAKSKNKKLLITTDCLSEGINLQEIFTAVLHYDLPWNPNRLEQREGRIDRFGQTAKEVKTYLLWGKNNPIDSVVLKVLLKKAREIRRQTGIVVPFPEDNQGILDALINSVLLSPKYHYDNLQLRLEFEEIENSKAYYSVSNAYEKAIEQDRATRSIFAQYSIKVNEIEDDLKQVDEAIGNPDAVKEFFIKAIQELGAQIEQIKNGYRLYTTNLDEKFKSFFDFKDKVDISFESPTPEGFIYLGRNHPFIEFLSQYVLNEALSGKSNKTFSRASVISTSSVRIKTTILLLRIRMFIKDTIRKNHFIAEEMVLWGYKGNPSEKDFISHEEAKILLNNTSPEINLPYPRQEYLLENELKKINDLKNEFNQIVTERSRKLIEAHERFRKLVGGSRYELAEQILPPDILGIYILIPIPVLKN